jgi:hypothetical protein
MIMEPLCRGGGAVEAAPATRGSGEDRRPRRRLLVEPASHHAKPYRVPGKTMRDHDRGHIHPLDQRPVPDEQPVGGNQPAHINLTARRT